ncbi:MAG: hypothetical protein AUH92_06715 [Acidobacteria bacterium 13_1_40CM_4_69_4]|nr:MAG: hypothetical protein AUH92_06715 [Acidobacteria bacterium 13_1_40CM_4_69_4]
MKRSLRVLPLLLVFLVPGMSHARDRRVEVERSPDGARVRTLRGELSPPSAEAPREIAGRFLAANAGLFRMKADLADLRLAAAPDSPGGRHFRFEQTYLGLPVFDAGAEVHVAGDGRVYLAHNDYVPGIDLSLSPARSKADVIRAALQDFLRTWSTAADKQGGRRTYAGEKVKLAQDISPELGVFAGPAPDDPAGGGQGTPRLAYRLVVFAESPFGVTEYILDARSAAVLRRRSLVQDTHITGSGRVFDPNPVNTLNDTSLRDNSDTDNPAFTPAYRTVPLPGLSRFFFDLFGPVGLSGPYVRINDFVEAPFIASPFSSTGAFLFTRDRQEFEDVMVYFHIDRSQRYIQSLGFTKVNNRSIAVDPHGLNGADNSHYVGFPFGFGWIAFGEGGVDDAEDADVILHEYGHSIQDNVTGGKYIGFGESGAQGEGFGDYWAFSNGPTGPGSFDPACLAEWDFQGSCLRRLDSTKHYPEDIVHEVHDDGEIWSSTLHDIFLALGKPAADTIVLESHFLVPFFPMFCNGAHALLDADGILYARANRAAIGTITAHHGIAGDLAAVNLSVTRPGFPTADVHFEIVNKGPCAVGPAAHSIRLICATSGDRGEVARVQRRTPASTAFSPTPTRRSPKPTRAITSPTRLRSVRRPSSRILQSTPSLRILQSTLRRPLSPVTKSSST